MSQPVEFNGVVEAIPVEEPSPAQLEAAVAALEEVVRAGCQDRNVLMMLALAHKRRGRWAEARRAFDKIRHPDAQVFLQLGLLSLQEKQLIQAEIEFRHARELDPGSFAVTHNLLLVELLLGQLDTCRELLPAATALAAKRNSADQQLLTALSDLLAVTQSNHAGRTVPALTGMAGAVEEQLLSLLGGLDQPDTVLPLLRALTTARPHSATARAAYCEAALLKGKQLIDRCLWPEAEQLLKSLSEFSGVDRPVRAVVHNLLGVCACMTKDFAGGVRQFGTALKLAGTDVRLHQNLALAHELAGNMDDADPHWNRFFDLLDATVNGEREAVGPGAEFIRLNGYGRRLAFEGMNRLATTYSDKEKWEPALAYLQRAVRLRPENFEALERLFRLAAQCRRLDEARRALAQMRRLRPAEPQFELYELDLHEVENVSDMESRLVDIQDVRDRHRGDARVEERATKMAGDMIPLISNVCDQLSDQLSRVVDQVRRLPNYQINWASVREVIRDLLKEFHKLRRVAGKCSSLVTADEQRRLVRDLMDYIDQRMQACRSLGN